MLKQLFSTSTVSLPCYRRALIHTKRLTIVGLGLYGSEVSASNFPLGTLGQKLLKVTLAVHRGKGFAIIRGLDPKEFSPEDNLIIFLGVSSYIGSTRGRQDEDGNMLSMFPPLWTFASLVDSSCFVWT